VGNLTFCRVTWKEYKQKVSDTLHINFCPSTTYKVCDIRPATGALYDDELRGYDFFGYGDIDVLYGDIRQFYTDNILVNHDVLSTHRWCLSGHFALLRNDHRLSHAFRHVTGWQSIFEDTAPRRFDEDTFTKALGHTLNAKDEGDRHQYSHPGRFIRRYFKEQFTTPLTPSPWIDGQREHPQVWYWRNGRITNDKNYPKEFIYLHFMNYRNARWMDSTYGDSALWAGQSDLLHFSKLGQNEIIRIDRNGFHAVQEDDLWKTPYCLTIVSDSR
jgi:hypothetical protein